MQIASFFATALIVLVTVVPFSRIKYWWVRDFDFPRFQFFTVAVLVLLVQLVWLDFQDITTWVCCGLNVLCCLYHGWWIYPYTPFHQREVRDASQGADNTLKIISSNVLMTNREAQKLLDVVNDIQPDILVTLESDRWWEEQLDSLGFPHSVKCPLDNLYGMHVYSQRPLIDAQLEFLVENNIPSIHAAVKLKNGQEVCLHFLHPAPPSPTENATSTARDGELFVVAKKIAETNKPTIVCGDLNDVAWSLSTRLFRRTSGLLDPRIGRGMFNTYNANYTVCRWPLDHVFHSEHFTLVSLQRLPPIGSDHFPLYSALAFEPVAKYEQGDNGLDQEAESSKKVEEDIDKVRASKEDVPSPAE
ncbi:endonuclease/exonuclease/phosphatase family protein [Aurantivibrio plasticivorans]